MESANDLVARLESMRARRANWDSYFQDLSDFEAPRTADFTNTRAAGSRRRGRLFDSTAEEAAERFASGLHNALTSEGSPWFYLKAADDTINGQREVRLWLEDTARRMYAVFNSPFSNFHATQHEKYLDVGVLGTAVQFIGADPARGPYFQSHFLGHSYIDVDDRGRVDTVFRVLEFTSKAAIQKFGPANVGEKIKKDFEQGKFEKKFQFLHAVYPRKDRIMGRIDRRNLPWASAYIILDGKERISEGGYEEFPFIVTRWAVNSQEIYARSPGMKALPDVKMLNQMEETGLRGLQKMVDPPLEIPDDGFLRTIDLRPGALNVRRNPPTGPHDRIQAIETRGRPDLGEAKGEQKRQAIRRHFYNDVFELPSPLAPDGDVIHAGNVEVAARLRDRLSILGPIFSRMKSEDLGPTINRTLQIMVRSGMTQPVPEALQGAEFEVEYVNPLAVAQGAGDVGAILQTVNSLRPLAEVKPEAMDRINVDAAAGIIADRLNMPAKALYSDEEMNELRRINAQAALEERRSLLNQTGAKTVKDLSGAGGNAQAG